nr:ribonuclease H-like domain-containing protein [Tanacetum cinerariifolium]
MALLSMRADRYWKKTGKKIFVQGTDVAGFDKSKVECFKCHKMGHFAREWRAPMSQDRGRRENFKQGSKVEESALKALMAIDGVGWDWSYMANEEEDHSLVADQEAPTEFALMAKSSSDTEVFDNSLCYKACKKNTDSLNTKITDLSEKLSDSKTMMYHYKLGLSQVEVRLVEFKNQEIKFCEKIRGLEFKGNSQNVIDDKGYWNSGCSRHMTGNISYLSDYEPYNGGYVSFGQGGYKITGKGTIKTVAKASADESELWHRRLGHLNFKTMNMLVRHNLVKGLPSKCFDNDHTCVACLKGKQHKASCKTKVVNSVTKPLHTLHMDLFGPTSVSSLNHKWVLVNNSQNKTPYELFNGRTPAIGFLKPFGCHVMILNTLDHLGKFEAKGDEGYFIRYFMSSKAFRVFNKRTKRVEENLHVEFLENKLIEKGAGPNWLFNIDTLTNSMNYVSVVSAGTTSTNFSGTKEAASQDVKKDVSSLRYIALPNWFHEAHLETSTSNAQDACKVDAPESSGNSNPTATSTNPLADQMKTLTVENSIPTVSLPVLTDCLDVSPQLLSDTRLISKRVTGQDDTPSLDNILTLSNRFEDILRVTTNTGDINRVEADLSNMENNISASPTHILRIHKDHPTRPIGTKWVLKNKKDERGIVIRNKARLVAQGHTQEEIIDYEEEAASQDVKKDVSSLSYIALPNWFHDAHLETSTNTNSGNFNPTATSTNPPAEQMETLTVETSIPTVSSPVPTACLDVFPQLSSDTRLILKRVTGQDDTPSLDNILTLSNRIKDILGVTTNTGDTNGVEADLSNMENNISASPTPTLRIHKDHPTIYHMDVKSAFLYGTIDEEVYVMQPPGFQDPWLLEPGVRPIGTKWVLKNKKDKRGIVIRNKAMLVAQGHTQEEGIDYEEGTIDQTLFIRKHRGDFILVQVYVDDIIFGSSNPQLCREFEALMHEKFQMSAMG